jgi:phage-related protein
MSKWLIQATPAAKRDIKALPIDLRARFIHISEMLEELGPHRVGEPHVKKLQAGLWEMRLRGKSGIARAIYFTATGRRLIVISAFVKKTQKTPKRELDLAIRRMKGLRNG